MYLTILILKSNTSNEGTSSVKMLAFCFQLAQYVFTDDNVVTSININIVLSTEYTTFARELKYNVYKDKTTSKKTKK